MNGNNIIKENMPKYSVLMSLYRKEKPEYLKLALDSMINQSISADEIVVVEDGPLTDELYSILDQYNPFIKRVRNETNLGLGLSLNIGLAACKNELIARMDTDDYSKPDRCEKQIIRFQNRPELAIVGSQIDEFENCLDNIISRRIVPLEYNEIYEFAKRRSAFNHPSVMYKKSNVLEAGGYSNLKRNQDVDLFGRMLFLGFKAENINESLLLFRSSSDLSKRRKSWENTWSYILTIYKFWKEGYSSFLDVLFVSMAQLAIYILPLNIQNFIYKNFLRK